MTADANAIKNIFLAALDKSTPAERAALVDGDAQQQLVVLGWSRDRRSGWRRLGSHRHSLDGERVHGRRR